MHMRKRRKHEVPAFRGKKPEPDRTRKNGTVLIVDDSPDFRKLLCDIFSKDRYVLTEDGFEGAIEVLRGIKIDLVICDLRMREDDDGFKLLAWVRENRTNTRFILMSSHIGESAECEAIRLGVDKIVIKTQGIHEFRCSVSEVLGAAAGCGSK